MKKKIEFTVFELSILRRAIRCATDMELEQLDHARTTGQSKSAKESAEYIAAMEKLEARIAKKCVLRAFPGQ